MPLSASHSGDGVCCGQIRGPFAGPSGRCASLSSFGKERGIDFPQLGHLYLNKVTLKAYWNPSLGSPSTLKPLRRTLGDLSLFYGNVSRKPMATYWRSLLATRSLYGSRLQLVLLRGHQRRTGLRDLRRFVNIWRQLAEDAFLEAYLMSA